MSRGIAAAAAVAYSATANAVALYSTIEIGPNLLAAITSIIGAVVLVAQLRLGKRVMDVADTAVEAHDKATHVEEVVELRKENRGPQARRKDAE